MFVHYPATPLTRQYAGANDSGARALDLPPDRSPARGCRWRFRSAMPGWLAPRAAAADCRSGPPGPKGRPARWSAPTFPGLSSAETFDRLRSALDEGVAEGPERRRRPVRAPVDVLDVVAGGPRVRLCTVVAMARPSAASSGDLGFRHTGRLSTTEPVPHQAPRRTSHQARIRPASGACRVLGQRSCRRPLRRSGRLFGRAAQAVRARHPTGVGAKAGRPPRFGTSVRRLRSGTAPDTPKPGGDQHLRASGSAPLWCA